MVFELDKNSYSRYLGRTFILLLEFTHSLLTPFYLTNDTQSLDLDGKTYLPFPFDLVLPSQSEQQGIQLVMSNVNQLVTNELAKVISSNENIICKVYICNRETETAEKYERGTFEVMDADINQQSINFRLNLRTSFKYNVGTKRYNQQLFRNLYL